MTGDGNLQVFVKTGYYKVSVQALFVLTELYLLMFSLLL